MPYDIWNFADIDPGDVLFPDGTKQPILIANEIFQLLLVDNSTGYIRISNIEYMFKNNMFKITATSCRGQ